MITIEQLKKYLTDAKNDHTKLYGNDPTHDWVTYYAEHMYINILSEQAREANGLIGLHKFRKLHENDVAVMHTGNPNKVISDFISDGTVKKIVIPDRHDHPDDMVGKYRG